MKGGEIILVAGAAGLGIFAILKFKNSQSSNVVAPPGAPPTISANFDMSGIGAAGPLGAPLAVLQPTVKAGIDKIDSSLGLTNPYAGLKKNSDGTYTDGMGCKLTFKPDGTYTRNCGNGGIVGLAKKGASGLKKLVSYL
jgi:hypothetical protein